MRPTYAPKAPSTYVEFNGKRVVGLHYVIVQCYPPQEKQLAEDAVKLLSANGIPATIETNVPYAPNWLAVVGVAGFDRVKSSREYDAYVARIEQIGAKFGGTSKFKKFEPRPYKWRETSKSP
jgi:hypothetical protein